MKENEVPCEICKQTKKLAMDRSAQKTVKYLKESKSNQEMPSNGPQIFINLFASFSKTL